MEMYLRGFAVWICIALFEMVHGIVRAKLLTPRVGDLRSRQIAVFTGSLLIFMISYVTILWMGPQNANDALGIGFMWFVCMMVFELSVGRFAFGFTWKWLFNDFNLFKGRLLALGMAFLAFAPYLTGRIRNIW